jgi:SAM-dependent methyltransferase
VDETAERGYSQCASAYARARPGVPPAALDWITETVPLRADTVIVELGAGTGTLTRLLAERSLQVVAVEPVAEMRHALQQTVAGVKALDGLAEHIPLGAAAAGAVIAANAVHWFKLDLALPEIHRVLGEHGALVLLSAFRDLNDPLQAELERIARELPYEGAVYPGHGWREQLAASDMFLQRAEEVFPLRQELDERGVRDLVSSWSIVGALPRHAQERVLDETRELIQGRGTVMLTYRTEVQILDAT